MDKSLYPYLFSLSFTRKNTKQNETSDYISIRYTDISIHHQIDLYLSDISLYMSDRLYLIYI